MARLLPLQLTPAIRPERLRPVPEERIAAFFRGPPTLKPGDYTVKLTVDGQTFTQPVTILPDPRNVPESAEPPTQGNDDDDI